jgi:hypothetical protein
MSEDKNIKQQYLDFDVYIRQGEPGKKDRAEAWRVAIGLQAVDGLKTSEKIMGTGFPKSQWDRPRVRSVTAALP